MSKRPHRLAVRTRPFQGRDAGSSPVGVNGVEIQVIEKRHLLRIVSKRERSDDYMSVQLKHTVGGVFGTMLVTREIGKKLKTGQLVDVEEDEDGELHLVDATPTRRQKAAAQPLRRVLGLVTVGRLQHELYECGHTRLPKQDMIGRTNARRRRCAKCARGQEPEPQWKTEAEQRLQAAEKSP